MNKLSILILAACCMTAHFAAEPAKAAEEDAPIKRDGKPSEFGMELFSWHVKGEERWHFALLPAPGTDKLKSIEFVTSKENALEGTAELKKKLAALPLNEKVGWFNMLDKKQETPDDLRFDFPPKEIIRELELYCTVLKVRLNIFQTAAKKKGP